MRLVIAAIFCGALFGAGLVISDMVNPARVLAFLDVAGAWDYTLALVMGGALIPAAVAFSLRHRLRAPLLGDRFHVPDSTRIDLPLVGGAVMFGLGWGLVGFCPGPALAALVTGLPKALIFFAAMAAGMLVHRLTLDRPKS
ncbi:DUF6691 family protein [Pseudomarimonas salicorniae]|uniref:YeeE/YedE family protein n=1 Tax=Pseudomarimonas salicorniae TaxID=2933270 RepID=A0ABT0GLX6_9GAMM|nr:DUF6691 family protein [Lysobacter sp. CAU 1642]MCK7595556.1 YeeE/YedE family protein [Lysobacter sp. CAU 1642]